MYGKGSGHLAAISRRVGGSVVGMDQVFRFLVDETSFAQPLMIRATPLQQVAQEECTLLIFV